MPQILIAPHYGDVNRPLIFLAGPIQGAPDWQSQAIRLLSKHEGLALASPRRNVPTPKGEFTREMYYEQVDWEHLHLALAAKSGVILFWLAKEAEVIPGRAYAQTTRFELGESVAYHIDRGAKVVVGIEKGFTNERYIRYTLGQKASGIPLCESLEETCVQAVRLALGE